MKNNILKFLTFSFILYLGYSVNGDKDILSSFKLWGIMVGGRIMMYLEMIDDY